MGEPAGWRGRGAWLALFGALGCEEPDGAAPPERPFVGEEATADIDAAVVPPAPRALEGWRDPAPQPPAASDPLFAEGTIHRIDLSLDPAARSALDADPRADVPATLRYGDDVWTVGLHLKGSFSYRSLAGKASFKVDFEEYEPGRRFFGLRRITLNGMVQDRSMIREHEAYWMYARLGVPAPRHGYAEVWLDGAPYGLYGVVESLDGPWAERVFPNDAEGPIYEGGYGVDLEAGDAPRFDLQRQGDLAEPYGDIAALIDELDATAPEDFLAWLDRRFDTVALFRMWAVDLLGGHRDGYVKRKNNFLLYHALRADRWSMVPWGQDQMFRDGMEVHGGYAGELAQRCAEVPACMARLDGAIAYVLGVWEAWDLHGHATGTGATVEAACARDPRKELPCGYERELDMILARPDEVRAELGL